MNASEKDHASGQGDGIQIDATLSAHFEKVVRPYIDLINEISDHGLENELALPSVVVIGDQSSGKSSILEAISGIQLPRGQEITTRCPIEMHLKKAETSKACIEYSDSSGKKNSQTVDLKSIDKELRAAQDRITKPGQVTTSKITLKAEGPSCPDLSLTDLPGIVRTAVDGDQKVIKKIRDLIVEYIERENVIILCIIPANLDLATNEVLAMAEKYDPKRKRTIGVLTKADLVEKNCEGKVMELLSNRKIPLKLGYCIVRCRNASEQGITHEKAIEQEKSFFANHPQFRHSKEDQRGTESLSNMLTQVLVAHMKEQLPRIRTQAREKLVSCERELDSFGNNVPAGEEARRNFMVDILDKVRKDLEKYLLRGGRIPKDIIKSENVPVDDLETQDCDTSFLWRHLFQHFNEDVGNITLCHLNFVNGNLSVRQIQNRMAAFRGKELPRFFNFELFEELICVHVKLYKDPAVDCLQEVTQGVDNIVKFVCEEDLKQFPALLFEVENECRSVLEECHSHAKTMILRELNKEEFVYTQDNTYISELKKLMDTESTSSNSSISGSETVKQLSIHMLHPEGEEGNEDQHNAQVMHHIVTVYLNVVNTRLSDCIPQTIRLDLYEKFVSTIQKSILRKFLNQDTKLIDEDPATASRRKALHEKIERLKSVTTKLKTF